LFILKSGYTSFSNYIFFSDGFLDAPSFPPFLFGDFPAGLPFAAGALAEGPAGSSIPMSSNLSMNTDRLSSSNSCISAFTSAAAFTISANGFLSEVPSYDSFATPASPVAAAN